MIIAVVGSSNGITNPVSGRFAFRYAQRVIPILEKLSRLLWGVDTRDPYMDALKELNQGKQVRKPAHPVPTSPQAVPRPKRT